MAVSLAAIVAMSPGRVIGRGNKLPWHLPEDLAFFKEQTRDGRVIMGRKTYESIGRPLPRRENWVLTRQPGDDARIHWITTCAALAELPDDSTHNWIIGGARLYAQTLPFIRELYVTHVKTSYEGDTFFPPFAAQFVEIEILRENPAFRIVRYVQEHPAALTAEALCAQRDPALP